MDILNILVEEFKIKPWQVENTMKLLEEDWSVPFIARYRKEATGNLDDIILRDFEERLTYLKNLKARKEEVLRLIEDQEKLTEDIALKIEKSVTLQQVEDIYRPFKPKRRTRGSMAREKGLENLAKLILKQSNNGIIEVELPKFVNSQKGVESEEEALDGARDIIAEMISDSADYRKRIRSIARKRGRIATSQIKGQEENTYEMYYDYEEPLSKLANHRVLAINRGEKEKILRVQILLPDEDIIREIEKDLITKDNFSAQQISLAIEDGYKRLLFPSMEREIRASLKERAEDDAIDVFSLNLEPLLLQAPIGKSRILALDPGFRTGCKLAAIDEMGNLLDYDTIYPTEPHNKTEASKKVLKNIIEKRNINLIAIGNGTASRETEQLVAELIKELDRDLDYTIVNEAGASIYSASKVGQEEFPDLDVSIRGAISIARRLQDPLPELVKIEPKHIGVGQYQHDLNQKKLDQELSKVVEDAVNRVGVDLNTASVSLLEYVSGLSKRLAKNIVDYRAEIGHFKNRKQLLKVKGLGGKTFTQAAGFLRIKDGDNFLDSTGVHPESYEIAEFILRENLLDENLDSLSEKTEIGVHTLKDIILELKKPGRDPRDEMPKPIFRKDVLELEDLEEGMELTGTVRNVVDFGAFVDIGVKEDGLVHISEMADRFIKHPKELVKVSDIVKVRIIDVDLKRGRIGLSMKESNK